MRNLPRLTPRFVKEALSETDWDFSNGILYKLCTNHPGHTRDDIIMAKVMLIGCAYSASIERGRKTDGATGDNFYKNKVARKIREFGIDNWFRALDKSLNDKSSESENRALNLETHSNVMKLFNAISGLDKRSPAAKYLHFHFRERFYIFDSPAQKSISKLTEPIGKSHSRLRKHDNV
jgi:hypothetical protein